MPQLGRSGTQPRLLDPALRQRPDPSGIRPPIEPLAHSLPLGEMRWEDFERLCVAVADAVLRPDHVQQYGEPGEDQDGIDLYVSLPDEIHVIQCRRVDQMGPADIKAAVDDFLRGEWAGSASTFVLATTQSLKSRRRAKEVLVQIKRLRAADKHFAVWDESKLSELLHRHPAVVRRFFGPEWELRFCGAPGRPPAVPVRRLRAPTPTFGGRADELAALDEWAARDGAGALALHGLGGVGKTELAAAWAERAAHHRDLAMWLDAPDGAALVAELEALAARLGVADGPGAGEALRDHLAEREGWLLVVDGLVAPHELGMHLPLGRGGLVLITSQHHGGWAAQGAARIAVQPLDRPDAVDLLLRTSGSDDAPTAAATAARLGDLPLAVAQAGAYSDATATGLNELAVLLDESPNRVLARGLPQTGAAVTRVWELAFTEVERADDAAALLYGMAWLAELVVPDGFLLALLTAAGHPGADLPETRERLLRFSLVTPDGDGMRMHRLVAEALRERGADRTPPRGLAEAITAVEADYPRDAPIAEFVRARGALEHALQTIEAGRDHSVGGSALARLMHRVANTLLWTARAEEAGDLLDTALPLLEAAGAEPLELAGCMNDAGLALRDMGRLAAAEETLLAALQLKREIAGRHGAPVVSTLTNLGTIAQRRGDTDRALDYIDEAIRAALTHEQVDVVGLAGLFGNRAIVRLDLKDHDAALADLKEEERLLRSLDPTPEEMIAAVKANRANALLDSGEIEASVAENRDALAAKRALFGDGHPTVADSWANLGNALRAAGRHADAMAAFETALRIHRAARPPSAVGIASATSGLGTSLFESGLRAEGLELMMQGLEQTASALGWDHQAIAGLRHNVAIAEAELAADID